MPKAKSPSPSRRTVFVKSASRAEECPAPMYPEIAILGRSNAGKSSLVNTWVGKGIAKVSSTPGKTTLLNFFDIEDKYTLVDLPGYGYASRGEAERVSWRKMIENYLRDRHSLVATILTFDSRREWTEDEASLVSWLAKHELPVVLAVTKIDKLNQSEKVKVQRKFSEGHGLAGVFLTSSLKNQGITQLEDFVFQRWIKPALV